MEADAYERMVRSYTRAENARLEAIATGYNKVIGSQMWRLIRAFCIADKQTHTDGRLSSGNLILNERVTELTSNVVSFEDTARQQYELRVGLTRNRVGIHGLRLTPWSQGDITAATIIMNPQADEINSAAATLNATEYADSLFDYPPGSARSAHEAAGRFSLFMAIAAEVSKDFTPLHGDMRRILSH